jgi:hypothetical protein
MRPQFERDPASLAIAVQNGFRLFLAPPESIVFAALTRMSILKT